MVQQGVDAQIEDENAIDIAAEAVELAVLAILARGIGGLDEDTSIVEAYAAIPAVIAEVKRMLDKGANGLYAEASRVLESVAAANDEWARPFYEASGAKQAGYASNEGLKALLSGAKEDAEKAIRDVCDTSVVGIVSNGEFKPIETAYKDAIASAVASMASGVQSGSEAVSQAVSSLAGSGLRVRYSSKITRELYSAVRMNVMGSYSRLFGEYRERQGHEFGADGVEVSAHIPCAPDHEPYQGRRFSKNAWELLQASLSRQLQYGANCRHKAYPVIMSIGKTAYSSDELAKMRDESNATVTITGLSGKQLSMTRYEASQYARTVEREARSQANAAYLLKQAGQDASKAEKSLKATKATYKALCASAGISPQMDRLKAFVVK